LRGLALIADPAWLQLTTVTAAIAGCRIAVIAVFASFELPIPTRNVDTRINAGATVAAEATLVSTARAALFDAPAATGSALARASLARAALTRAASERRWDTRAVNALEARAAG
jgi:hypothetical protein